MKKILLSIGLIGLATALLAQTNLTQKYQYPISGSIEMIEKMPGGIALIGSSDGISGIEAHSNEVKYTYTKMGKIKPEEMQIIPNTSYIILSRGYSKLVIDYITGKEVFTPAENGWGAIMSISPDFSNNTLTIMGTTNKGGYALGVYNLNNFAKIGMVEFSDKKQMGVYINALTYYESEGKLFVRTEKGIVCIDKNKITTDWVYSDLDKTSGIIKVVADPAKGEYYICESNGKNHYLHKLNSSGNLTTKKPVKIPGMPQNISLTDKMLYTHTADLKTTFIQFYNRETSLPLWKKAFAIKGPVFMTQITPNGLVYAAQTGAINTIDLTSGKTILKKEIKTGAVYKNVILLPNDLVFYLSLKDMGVANLKTGEYIKEPAKFKKVTNMITAYDEKNDRLIVSTGTELYFIKKDGSNTKVMDLKFKEEETPSKIEFREKGILIGAAQNNMLISYDGKIIYESYYKAPGQSLAAKIALGAVTAALASQSVGQGMAGNQKDSRQSSQAASGLG
ncbi:MAG: hypothetical protein K9J84_08965, partial [Bacteroidia bacterium]|nr:hypothetical protein [Bacteroidia bacterium]